MPTPFVVLALLASTLGLTAITLMASTFFKTLKERGAGSLDGNGREAPAGPRTEAALATWEDEGARTEAALATWEDEGGSLGARAPLEHVSSLPMMRAEPPRRPAPSEGAPP